MLSQEIYENIEAYINGTLTGTDLMEFEQKLQNDSNLATDIQLIRRVDDTLGDQSSLEVHQKVEVAVDDFLAELVQEESAEIKTIAHPPIRKIGGWAQRWAVAASFLLLAVIVVVLWQLQSPTAPSHQELFSQNFSTYPLDEDVRSGEETTGFEKGVDQYRAKKFKAAAQVFQSLIAVEKNDMVLAFCLANAYLNQSPPQKNLANEQFQRILTDGASVYVPKAQWYLALMALEGGKLEEAKVLLEEIRESGDEFAQKAKELLEELD